MTILKPEPMTPEQERMTREIIARPYTRILVQDSEEGYWFVRIAEFDGCMSDGETPEEALTNLEDAMYEWVADHVQMGREVPAPRDPFPAHSGRFVLRLPRTLHRDLAECAETEGVSLNALCAALLARGLGARDTEVPSQAAPSPRRVARASEEPGEYRAGRRGRSRA